MISFLTYTIFESGQWWNQFFQVTNVLNHLQNVHNMFSRNCFIFMFSLFIRNGGKIDFMLFEEKKFELATTHQQGLSPIICWDLKIFRDGAYKIMSMKKIRQVKYIQR